MTTQEYLDNRLKAQLKDAENMIVNAETAHEYASLIRSLAHKEASVAFSSFCYPEITVINANIEDVRKVVKALRVTLFKSFNSSYGTFSYTNKRKDYYKDVQITMRVDSKDIPYCKVTMTTKRKTVKVYEVECKPQSPWSGSS